MTQLSDDVRAECLLDLFSKYYKNTDEEENDDQRIWFSEYDSPPCDYSWYQVTYWSKISTKTHVNLFPEHDQVKKLTPQLAKQINETLEKLVLEGKKIVMYQLMRRSDEEDKEYSIKREFVHRNFLIEHSLISDGEYRFYEEYDTNYVFDPAIKNEYHPESQDIFQYYKMVRENRRKRWDAMSPMQKFFSIDCCPSDDE